MRGASRSTGSSGSGGAGSGDKWAYRDRRYRHEQNGAGRATFVLVGLALMQTAEAASTVAILAPLGSGSALLVMAKFFLFSSAVKVVNKVSEDAEYLTASAIDAADQAISWTLWLYQIVQFFASSCCWAPISGSHPAGSTIVLIAENDNRQRVPQGSRWTRQDCSHTIVPGSVSLGSGVLPEILKALCACI